MKRRAPAHIVTTAASLLALSVGSLWTPALGLASSGGTSISPTPGPPSSPPTTGSPPSTSSGAGPTQAQPGNVPVTANGNGITVTTQASALLHKPLSFTGNAGSANAGATIEIERRGRETNWQWAPTTHGTASSSGSFSAVWPVNHIGQFDIRAVVERARTARAAAVTPAVTITVYRPSLATVYGPGFWGKKTACGVTLRPNTLGLAHKTLPCGTKVALYYQGKTITVPVIDRGPYAHGADWDLTSATARSLGVSGIATVGAVSLPRS